MLLAEREKRALQAALVQIFGQRCRLRQPTGSVILQLRQKKAGEDIRRSRRAVLSEQCVRQLRRQQAERFLYPAFQREPAHIAFQRNGRAFFLERREFPLLLSVQALHQILVGFKLSERIGAFGRRFQRGVYGLFRFRRHLLLKLQDVRGGGPAQLVVAAHRRPRGDSASNRVGVLFADQRVIDRRQGFFPAGQVYFCAQLGTQLIPDLFSEETALYGAVCQMRQKSFHLRDQRRWMPLAERFFAKRCLRRAYVDVLQRHASSKDSFISFDLA